MRSLLKKLVRKVLAVEEEEYEWMEPIKGEVLVLAENMAELLRKKHLIDELHVLDEKGSVILTTKPGAKDPFLGEAIFSVVSGEIPESTAIFVKEKDWYIIYRKSPFLYVIRAPSSLSMGELKAIARDVERVVMKKWQG